MGAPVSFLSYIILTDDSRFGGGWDGERTIEGDKRAPYSN